MPTGIITNKVKSHPLITKRITSVEAHVKVTLMRLGGISFKNKKENNDLPLQLLFIFTIKASSYLYYP